MGKMWIVSCGYIRFSLLLWVIFPTGYQYNIRFQNLIYVLILIRCINVEEQISWVYTPEALPILKIQVCTKFGMEIEVILDTY